MKLHKDKTVGFQVRINVPTMIVIAAIVSSGCAALAGLGGGMMLAEKGGPGGATRGWQTQSNAQPDPNADAGYLYGVWKDDTSIP